MGHRTHSVARAKLYLEDLGTGWRRGHILIAPCDGFVTCKYFLLWHRLFDTPLSLIDEACWPEGVLGKGVVESISLVDVCSK